MAPTPPKFPQALATSPCNDKAQVAQRRPPCIGQSCPNSISQPPSFFGSASSSAGWTPGSPRSLAELWRNDRSVWRISLLEVHETEMRKVGRHLNRGAGAPPISIKAGTKFAARRTSTPRKLALWLRLLRATAGIRYFPHGASLQSLARREKAIEMIPLGHRSAQQVIEGVGARHSIQRRRFSQILPIWGASTVSMCRLRRKVHQIEIRCPSGPSSTRRSALRLYHHCNPSNGLGGWVSL